MVFGWKTLILSFLVFGVHPPIYAHADKAFPKSLVFSIIDTNLAQIEAAKTLKKAYGQLGVPVDFLPVPGRRALEFSNSGKTDGEVFRIKTITEKYRNLRIVPSPVMLFQGIAYSTQDISITSWKDMQSYRIGIIRGVVWSEKRTRGFKVARFDTNEDLFNKLLAGGVDVIVGTSFSIEREISDRDLDVKIFKSKPLMQFSVYHFLNKKHENLIEPVSREISKIVGNGFSPE